MILSSQKLREAVEAGSLGITPFDESNLKEASYVLTLGPTLKKIRPAASLSTEKKLDFEELTIPAEGYLLQPGEFILGRTQEKISLKGTYGCMLSARASCAQIGLNLLLNSTFAEPDTDSEQTLEILNSSNSPIVLTQDMPIVKAIFMEISA